MAAEHDHIQIRKTVSEETQPQDAASEQPESQSAKRELSDVQAIIWDILKELKPYLERHRIPYFMLGGTLLGAVRHRGFIPWDDDIDIGIPREYYDVFLKKVGKELPEHLKLRTFRNSRVHHYYFARIVDTRHFIRRHGSEETRDEEVWIDVFPLDGMPRQKLIRLIHEARLMAVRMIYHISCFDRVNLKRPGRPLSERIVIKFVQLTGFGRNADTRRQLEKLDKLLKKYPYRGSPYVVNFMGQYKLREMFPKWYYGKGKMYAFEDTELPGPVHADKVLRQMYGDYMTPPENKNAHAAEFVG